MNKSHRILETLQIIQKARSNTGLFFNGSIGHIQVGYDVARQLAN